MKIVPLLVLLYTLPAVSPHLDTFWASYTTLLTEAMTGDDDMTKEEVHAASQYMGIGRPRVVREADLILIDTVCNSATAPTPLSAHSSGGASHLGMGTDVVWDELLFE